MLGCCTTAASAMCFLHDISFGVSVIFLLYPLPVLCNLVVLYLVGAPPLVAFLLLDWEIEVCRAAVFFRRVAFDIKM